MASSLELIGDKREKNGGLSNGNREGLEDDPQCLMEEFCCLYSEKLKAIDEEYPDSLEPKCQALTELVSDLTEQNYMLLKTVEELEKEALNRVEAFNDLAEAAKDTIQQDNLRRGVEQSKSVELENKVAELQASLKNNESHLSSCVIEIDRLNKCLQEKKDQKQDPSLGCIRERMSDFETLIKDLEADLKEKCNIIQSLQEENEKLRCGVPVDERIPPDIASQLSALQDELDKKNAMLKKVTREAYTSSQESRFEVASDPQAQELAENLQWMQSQLEEKQKLLLDMYRERDTLLAELQKANNCISTQKRRISELTGGTEPTKRRSPKENVIMDMPSSESFMPEGGRYYYDDQMSMGNEYPGQVSYIDSATVLSPNTPPGEDNRMKQLVREITNLKQEIDKKNSEILNYKDHEERLKSQLSKMKVYTCDLEKQWKEQASRLNHEIEKKNALLQKFQQKLGKAAYSGGQDQKIFSQHYTPGMELNCFCLKTDDKPEIHLLKLKLKDVQEALTAEIADKHDEIRRLKDDVKELEEKLLHSDKQTQFKDDIIKELRKEVKVGRAKESLAEMLGLKDTPRAAMKTRIDNLMGQLEEMRNHVFSVEERLAECNLPAVISLRSRLKNAEGSLLAMCNKMDYVRRYLENLKGDEELSIKCGLEALLSELREDVEWNRQTRRNLSLDEGTSVIVISHRSHSLPDNSLHRFVTKTKSDSVVSTSKHASSFSQQSLDTFEECRNYIQVITDLEREFEETQKSLSYLWDGFQSYAKDNGDSILNDFNNILSSYENSKKRMKEIMRQMKYVNGSNSRKETTVLYYNIQCLKDNLLDISESLLKAHMVSNCSETDFLMEAGDARGLKQKLSSAINDSLSIIQTLEREKMITQKKASLGTIETYLPDIISSIRLLFEEMDKFYEKIIAIQKQHSDFSEMLLKNIMEFERGFSSYNSSAENLRKEIRNLFAIILTKEKQIQKQFDEIDNLKMALTSNKYVEEGTEEIDSLRNVMSNKELQLVGKHELIQSLRSVNFALRRRQLSQSSPSLSCTSEIYENVVVKSQLLEDGLLSIKKNFSTITDFLRSKNMMMNFGKETKQLVKALARVHNDITTAKESLQNPQLHFLLQDNLIYTESKVEKLLRALDFFICGEQTDCTELSDSINEHLDILLNITEFIKESFENDRLLIKSLSVENKELKLQLISDQYQSAGAIEPPNGANGSREELANVKQDHKEEFLDTESQRQSVNLPPKQQKSEENFVMKSTLPNQKEALKDKQEPEEFPLKKSSSPIRKQSIKDEQEPEESPLKKSSSPIRKQSIKDEQKPEESPLKKSSSPIRKQSIKDEQEPEESPLTKSSSPIRKQSIEDEQETEEFPVRRGSTPQSQNQAVGVKQEPDELSLKKNTPQSQKQFFFYQQQSEEFPMTSAAKSDQNQLVYDKREKEKLREKDELIHVLEEDLAKCRNCLEEIQKEYSLLKLEKETLQERNQKVMEELQNKIVTLQTALHEEPESDVVYQLSCMVEQQSLKICQFENREKALKLKLSKNNEDLENNNNEVKNLKTKLNNINRMYIDLQRKFVEAKEIIDEIQGNLAEKEKQINCLKNKLIAVETLYAELQLKYEDAKELILLHNENVDEKEQEIVELKHLIDCQQRDIDSFCDELKKRCDELNEMQEARNVSGDDVNVQLQELVEVKEKVAFWENLMLRLRKEISDRTEEVRHWQNVSCKQKENLADLIEENQALKTETAEYECEKAKLLFDLENNQRELIELTTEVVKSRQIICQIKQEKSALENLNNDLQALLQEKEKYSNENIEEVDRNTLQEQEDFIEVLVLRIAQMNSFIADRDETINLLESQLKTSTMLMLDNSDFDESKNQFCPSSIEEETVKMTSVSRLAAYKMKLWQTLEVNRKLINIINSLQQLNYSLHQEKVHLEGCLKGVA